MENNNKELKWMLLMTKIDGLNRRVKEPGWTFEDKQEVYRLKDSILDYILRCKPEVLSVELFLVPYYSYSRESKDRAGDLMRRDTERKPFEYYLGQISPGVNDIEIPEKATVEFVITCMGQEFSFHQPLSWYTEHGGEVSQLRRKAWISASNFHHTFLERIRNEINTLQKELED